MIAKLEETARPYAHAVFQFANERKALSQWAGMLEVLVTICTSPPVMKAIASPQYNLASKIKIIFDIAGDLIDGYGQNFVRLLGENGRLKAVAEIYRQFNELVDASKNRMEVDVITSTELSPVLEAQLIKALEKRTKAKIKLHPHIDPTLLGGIQLRLGNEVIDGSISGKLRRLALHLKLKESVCP